HGGWVGGGVGIGQLRFFRKPTATAVGYDPDTGEIVLHASVSATQALGRIEALAIDDVITRHGLAPTERENVAIWARDQVRAEIFGRLAEIAAKPEAERNADEQVVADWLELVVWQRRIDVAQAAWEQYL